MFSNMVVNLSPIQMSGRMVKEACKAAAGSMAELAEEKARYGGKEEQDGEKDDKKKGEDYYEKTIQFECNICGLCEMCQYLGRKPPFTKHLLEFDEEVFVMIDPFKVYQRTISLKNNEKLTRNLFQPRQSRWFSDFLVLGGTCAACNAECCQDCSIYFSKRFCIKCAEFNINEFPKDVQSKIVKLAGALASKAKS